MFGLLCDIKEYKNITKLTCQSTVILNIITILNGETISNYYLEYQAWINQNLCFLHPLDKRAFIWEEVWPTFYKIKIKFIWMNSERGRWMKPKTLWHKIIYKFII